LGSFRHLVLTKGLKKYQHRRLTTHASACENLIILTDIVGNEFVCFDITSDVNGLVSHTASHIHQSFVVLSAPEEGNGTVRDHFAKHVEGSVSAHIQGRVPVLTHHLATCRPVWVKRQVTRSIDILSRCL